MLYISMLRTLDLVYWVLLDIDTGCFSQRESFCRETITSLISAHITSTHSCTKIPVVIVCQKTPHMQLPTS